MISVMERYLGKDDYKASYIRCLNELISTKVLAIQVPCGSLLCLRPQLLFSLPDAVP